MRGAADGVLREPARLLTCRLREGWPSGRRRQSRKLLDRFTGPLGSNPSPSAEAPVWWGIPASRCSVKPSAVHRLFTYPVPKRCP